VFVSHLLCHFLSRLYLFVSVSFLLVLLRGFSHGRSGEDLPFDVDPPLWRRTLFFSLGVRLWLKFRSVFPHVQAPRRFPPLLPSPNPPKISCPAVSLFHFFLTAFPSCVYREGFPFAFDPPVLFLFNLELWSFQNSPYENCRFSGCRNDDSFPLFVSYSFHLRLVPFSLSLVPVCSKIFFFLF